MTAVMGSKNDGGILFQTETNGNAYFPSGYSTSMNRQLTSDELSSSTWNQIGKLVAQDGASGDWFGYNVAVSGDMVVVGAPNYEYYIGSAYIFNATTGDELYQLAVSDGAAGDEFGYSVAILGDLVVVGAPYYENYDIGSAYIFNATTGDEL
eukprot:CAMPEP_0178911340 /NCGR_PEP_ID=MMETSP0786-20121207/9643_1 /TAXON_ID=186022 /ORGANISM="Thalassionema frauenfeldii, Strain CCMP 1798" /LENGTH=151 /DNA_ID=CAMNT_0020583781 /DNA_START=264 /DNA_END=716 /DNA_ORIENTATION=+